MNKLYNNWYDLTGSLVHVKAELVGNLYAVIVNTNTPESWILVANSLKILSHL